MKRFTISYCALVWALSLSGNLAAAPIVVGPGAFSGSDTLIDFVGIPFEQAVTNQYSAQGVIFTNAFSDPLDAPGNFGTNGALSNIDFANAFTVHEPLIASFAPAITRVGFDITGGGSTLTVTSFFHGSPTGVFNFTANGATFFGIQDPTGIDSIQITGNFFGSPGAFLSTNYIFGGDPIPAPEPTSLAIWSMLGLGGAWWQRRKTRTACVA